MSDDYMNPKNWDRAPEELQAMVDALDHKGLRDVFNKVGREFGLLPMGHIPDETEEAEDG